MARVSSFDDGVVVDGIRFDTSHASIRIDERPGTASELEPGQLVAVEGEVNEFGEAFADDVVYVSDVQGVVSEVNVKDGAFRVLGQQIQVVDSTLFGDGIHPARMNGLRPGLAVAVSAFRGASGELVASRVVLADALLVAQARGIVERLDPVARTFRINELSVAYAGALVTGSISNGVVATVRGPGTSAPGVLLASQVEVSGGILSDAGVAATLEGLVTRIDPGGRFELSGARVAIVGKTKFEPKGVALQLDQRVDVRGTFDAAGVLIADRIGIEPLSLDVISGFIESLSPADHTVQVQGVGVTLAAETILEDRARHPVHDFQLSDLRVGDFIEVRGQAQGTQAFSAAVLQREDPPKGVAKKAKAPKRQK
jgi:hypothetical protein